METVIIKKGEKYYFTSEDQVYELNEATLNRLKVRLTLPTNVLFRDCPFSFIGNIVSTLFDEKVDIAVSRIGETNNYQANFSKSLERHL